MQGCQHPGVRGDTQQDVQPLSHPQMEGQTGGTWFQALFRAALEEGPALGTQVQCRWGPGIPDSAKVLRLNFPITNVT
jgi:hypothetical protein